MSVILLQIVTLRKKRAFGAAVLVLLNVTQRFNETVMIDSIMGHSTELEYVRERVAYERHDQTLGHTREWSRNSPPFLTLKSLIRAENVTTVSKVKKKMAPC